MRLNGQNLLWQILEEGERVSTPHTNIQLITRQNASNDCRVCVREVLHFRDLEVATIGHLQIYIVSIEDVIFSSGGKTKNL